VKWDLLGRRAHRRAWFLNRGSAHRCMAVSPSRWAGGDVIAGTARGAPPRTCRSRSRHAWCSAGCRRGSRHGRGLPAHGGCATGPAMKLDAAVMSCRSFCVSGTFPHSLAEFHFGRELIRGRPISTRAISCVNAPVARRSMGDCPPDVGGPTMPPSRSAYDFERSKVGIDRSFMRVSSRSYSAGVVSSGNRLGNREWRSLLQWITSWSSVMLMPYAPVPFRG
jgi:hypothetical protein